jgi:hypothetical protein
MHHNMHRDSGLFTLPVWFRLRSSMCNDRGTVWSIVCVAPLHGHKHRRCETMVHTRRVRLDMFEFLHHRSCD